MEARSVLPFDCSSIPDIDAVILWESGTFTCFARIEGGGFALMTYQEGFVERPLVVSRATALRCGTKCVPLILERMGLNRNPRIALVMSTIQDGWSEVLNHFISETKKSRRMVPFATLSIQAFELVGIRVRAVGERLTWQPMAVTPMREAPQTRLEPPSRGDNHTSVDQPQAKELWFSFDDAEDVPAEVTRILWKIGSIPPTADQATRGVLEALSSREMCFSTLEAAQLLAGEDAGTVTALIRTFRMLRSWEGGYVFVPMVGFRKEFLYAEPLLSSFSQGTGAFLSIQGLLAVQDSVVSIASFSTNHPAERLVSVALRCLNSGVGSLRLLDLAEDVICSLTGRSNFRLSFADVMRLVSCLKDDRTFVWQE